MLRVIMAAIRQCCGRDWKDPHLYHMMMSSRLGDGKVAPLILDAVKGARRNGGIAMTARGERQKANRREFLDAVFLLIALLPWLTFVWLLWPRE